MSAVDIANALRATAALVFFVTALTGGVVACSFSPSLRRRAGIATVALVTIAFVMAIAAIWIGASS